MTDTISERRTREQELEAYIAKLHDRIRHLEGTLSTLGIGLGAFSGHVSDQLDKWPVKTMPEGIHKLSRPERDHAPDGAPSWTVTCSCGWATEPMTRSEGAEAMGMGHVREQVGSDW